MLTNLCEEHSIKAGEVRVSGALKTVELARFDPAQKDYVKAHQGGPAEIITLQGSIATIGNQVVLRLDSLVSVDHGFGIQLASGQVRRAVVSSCEFVIDVFDDIAMTRGRDPKTGRLMLAEIESTRPAAEVQPQAAPEPAQAAVSWGDVSAASSDPSSLRAPEKEEKVEAPAPKPEPKPEPVKEKPRPKKEEPPQRKLWEDKKEEEEDPHSILGSDDDDFEDDDDSPEMKPGDILDHPKLGRCRVMKVEEEDYAHIRLPRGKISKLILHIFEIQFKGVEDGRNVFTLRMRK